MSSRFSEASELVLKNWDTVTEIHRAEKQLASELQKFLSLDLQRLLKNQPWWEKGGWHFVRHQETQFYIARQDWKRGEDYDIWIGIEGFSIDNIFGKAMSPTLYVWVRQSNPALASTLRDFVKTHENYVGEVETRSGSLYVVKHALRKCLPEEIDDFEEVIGPAMVEFFTCYADLGENFSAYLCSSDAS